MAGTKEAPRSEIKGREATISRQRKLWWVLPLVVLLLLVGVIYVLGHMGSADSEMYPTTGRQVPVTARLC
jgi:hypothetical protein